MEAIKQLAFKAFSYLFLECFVNIFLNLTALNLTQKHGADGVFI